MCPRDGQPTWRQPRLLRREMLDSKARDLALATVEQNARAQLHLLDELLEVSRIGSDAVQLERPPVDLSALAATLLDALAARAGERGGAWGRARERDRSRDRAHRRSRSPAPPRAQLADARAGRGLAGRADRGARRDRGGPRAGHHRGRRTRDRRGELACAVRAVATHRGGGDRGRRVRSLHRAPGRRTPRGRGGRRERRRRQGHAHHGEVAATDHGARSPQRRRRRAR